MTRKLLILYCIIAVILVIGTGLFVQPADHDAQSIYWLRLAQHIQQDGIVTADTAVIATGGVPLNAYPYLLALSTILLGSFGLIALNALLALLSILLLWNTNLPARAYLLGLFLASPLFSAHYTRVSDQSLYLVIALSFILLLRSRYWILALVPAIILGLRSWVDIGVLILISIVAWQLTTKKAPAIATLALCVPLALVRTIKVEHNFSYPQEHVLDRIFFEFGQSGGISIVLLLLALVGAYHLWHNKQQFSVALLAIVAFSAYALINLLALFYLSIALLCLGAIALEFLTTRTWEVARLKHVFLFFIGIIILANATSAAQSPSTLDTHTLAAFAHLSLSPTGNLFTHYSISDSATYHTQHPVLLSSRPDQIARAEERYLDSLQLFHTIDQATTHALLDKYNITYILITPDMNNGLVWEEPGRGIQYVQSISNRIAPIYEKDGAIIYRVTS